MAVCALARGTGEEHRRQRLMAKHPSRVGHTANGTAPHCLLDALSRAELTPRRGDLVDGIRRSVAHGEDVSVAVLVSGSGSQRDEIDRASARLAPDVRVLGIQIVPGEPPYVATTSRGVVARLGQLDDLPLLLRQEVAA